MEKLHTIINGKLYNCMLTLWVRCLHYQVVHLRLSKKEKKKGYIIVYTGIYSARNCRRNGAVYILNPNPLPQLTGAD